jgi:LmbE family N-acetylglucosaminyl deacetylase
MKKMIRVLIFLFTCFIFRAVNAQNVLIITAHPDDEVAGAVAVYKITHELKGNVDLALITNGEGGYKYSTLAEDYYHLNLTDEKVGRKNLPRIRKTELMNAGKIIGIRNYFFLDQQDKRYTTDEREPLDSLWNVSYIKKQINKLLAKTKYDYIFCLLPVPGTHGHHKAATMLALEIVNALPMEKRPVILGMSTSGKQDTIKTEFTRLKNYTLTEVNENIQPFVVDRTVKFGYKNSLDYKIILNWEVAEHKSQGTIQMEMNQGDYENFWYFKLNGASGIEKTKKLFDELKKVPYPEKIY